MTMLNLFLGFLKVGCFSFGGAYAAIPLIRDIVHAYGWLDDEMLSYMIAVSESTPGPIMVNLATYVGTSQAGLPGAMLATFAVVMPSFLIVLLVTAILSRLIKNSCVQSVLSCVKPAMAGIILATGGAMIVRNLFPDPAGISVRALVITAALALIYYGQKKIIRKNVSPILLIVIAAIFGIVGYGL